MEINYLGNNSFEITSDGKNVGEVTLNDKAEIRFEIKKDMRGEHFASRGLYDITAYIHKELHEPIIHAIVEKDNEMAIHVLEHNGYEIISKDEKNIYFEHRIEETRRDDYYTPGENKGVIYLAGGCFWGMERAFKLLDGVCETKVGYANGHVKNPTYEEVCRHETGYRECLRITYDTGKISVEKILKAYFICVDPTQADGQGGDIGEQYLLGIYTKDEKTKDIVDKYLDEERKKHKAFYVENKALECFYEAEEYHQDYLLKHPGGYCHITFVELEKIKELNND